MRVCLQLITNIYYILEKFDLLEMSNLTPSTSVDNLFKNIDLIGQEILGKNKDKGICKCVNKISIWLIIMKKPLFLYWLNMHFQ